MNFAEIEKTWRSAHNQPTPAELVQDKMKFIADLKRRRRGFVIFLSLVFTSLSALTARIIFQVLRPETGTNAIDAAREWGALLLLALPWIGAIYFLRAHLKHRAQHANYERSIAASARALLDENRLSRTRLKVVGALHGLVLVLLPIIAHQLRATGKAGPEILLPAYVIWPAIAAAIGVSLWLYDRRRLLPQKRQLESLVASYQ